MYRIVDFPSEGANLRGRLYIPHGASHPLPAVIMAHGFSATANGMTADCYAEVFCEAGMVVLLYDHRNFGMSGGEPRQEINRWVQARGYHDAIDFMMTLPEIDKGRIAIWGDSMSGAEVIVVGALDPRVKAVVAQVPACGDKPAPPDPDGQLFNSLQDTFYNGDVRGTPETTTGPMPIVSFDQKSIPSLLTPLTAFRWFIEYGGRYGTLWENWATYSAPITPAPFHPLLCAPHLKKPLLMVIAKDDEMPGANSHISRMVFDAAQGPKQLIEMDGGHFGLLYYPSSLFDFASKAQLSFLSKYCGLEDKMTVQATDRDSQMIIQAAADYYSAWYGANVEMMASCLHPDLAKRAIRKDAKGNDFLHQLNKEQMLEKTREGGGSETSKENQRYEITILDRYEEIASVKVVAFDYIDYLHIAKQNGEWRIVNALWTDNRDRRAP